MYLFSRRRSLNPAQSRAGVAFSIDIAQRVSQVIGQEIRPWATVHSREVGTVVWSMSFPDLEALEMASDKLVADAASMDAIEASDGLFVGAYEDTLLQVVQGTVDPNRRPQYVTVVQGQLRPGKLIEGMAAASEVVGRVAAITGQQLLLASQVTGPFAVLEWIGLTDSIGELDRQRAALFADPGYVEFLDASAGLLESTTSVTILRGLT